MIKKKSTVYTEQYDGKKQKTKQSGYSGVYFYRYRGWNEWKKVITEVGRNGTDYGIDFIPDGVPRLSALTAEQFHDTDLSHLTPKRTVMRESHVSTVIRKVTYSYRRRSVRKYVVLYLQHLTCCFRVRNGHHVHEPHAEAQNAAVSLGQVRQTAVR